MNDKDVVMIEYPSDCNCAIMVDNTNVIYMHEDLDADGDEFYWALRQIGWIQLLYCYMAIEFNTSIVNSDDEETPPFLTESDTLRNVAGYFGYEELSKVLRAANTRKDLDDDTTKLLHGLEPFVRMHIPQKKNIQLASLVIVDNTKNLAPHECIRPILQKLMGSRS